MFYLKQWKGKCLNFKLCVIFISTLLSLQIFAQTVPLLNSIRLTQMVIIKTICSGMWAESTLNLALISKSCSTLKEQIIIKDIVTDLLPFAQAITVKINLDGGFGSGVLIGRQGKIYTIVTNAHVIRNDKSPYYIETFDGNIYDAEVLDLETMITDQDIAILKFYSPTIVYPIAQKGKLPQKDDFVLTVGFTQKQLENIQNEENSKPNKPQFEILTGKITFVLDKPLKEGYQIGYSNPVIEGMSGGAILNQKGELVGINGMRAYPILGDPYIYDDDTIPNESLRELMIKSSWGIPITQILHYVK